MKAVNNYLKNVMKSVTYAAADVSGEYLGGIQEFTSTNKEFATATYAALKNPKQFVKKQAEAIQESKIYKALDYGARNLTEDLRTGNWYNKERKERDEAALAGLDADNWNDLSEFDIDDDWEKNLDSSSSSKNDEVTAGDIKIVQSIEGSNAALASATVNAVVATSNHEIKNSRANTAMLYTQNERLFGGLHKDMTVLGSTMQQMYNLQSASLQNIDKNMSSFFTQESKLSTERNAMLKEMLEMQRNMYKSASDKEKEAANKKKNNRITWDDINVNGIVNINEYFKAVKKNINNQLATVMPAGFGEDSNMLATFMTSPLEGAMKYVVNGVIPATVKAAAKEFDGTVSGVFGNIIAELGNARTKNDSGLLGTIAKFFGVSTSVNRNIDTSRYEKGPVPFDGITRKAIIDVIPTYLRHIEAAITGRPEEMFDYKAGRWVKVSNIKKQFDDIKKNSIKRGTSDIRSAMNPGIQAVRNGLTSKSAQEEWDKAIEEFELYLYNNNGRFNSKASAEKNGITRYEYENLYKNYNKIRTIFNDFDRIESTNSNGKKITRHTNNKVRMRLTNNILDARGSEEKQYRNIESDNGNIFQSLFGIDLKSIDSHGKTVNGKFKAYNILSGTTDKLGNTIFDYLQNINKELTWFRKNGIPGGGGSSATGNGVNSEITMQQIESEISKNKSSSATNDYNRKKAEAERFEKKALDKIASGKAVDLRDFDVNEQAALLRLSSMISNDAVSEYKSKIKGYNENIISGFIDRHYIKTNIKNMKDVDEAIKKAEKEGKNTNEVMDAKEEKFFGKLMKRIKGGEDILGGIVGASAESFTNLLYAADRAIYEMMYKTEISDEAKNKYNGFMDMIAGKTTEMFKDIKQQFKDIFEPFKERLGITEENKKRFKDGLMNTGSKLWTAFKDANSSVYGPIMDKIRPEEDYEELERRRLEEEKQERKENQKYKNNTLRNFKNNAFKNASTKITNKNFNRAISNGTKEWGALTTDSIDAEETRNIRTALIYGNDPEARAIWCEKNGFNGTLDEKKVRLGSEFGLNAIALSKIKTDDDANLIFIKQFKHHATGTPSGKPFSGLTTLTKGEGLISSNGFSVVPKTGVYNISKPTHIINTEDMHDSGLTKGPRVSVQSALGKEKLAAKSAGFKIASHYEGTDKIKITNKGVDLDTEEFLSQLKQNIPEAASGGLIGGILSLVLGTVGGPLVGAAVGAGASVIAGSDKLKDNLFGKAGEDGKRDGSGVISKSIMDAYNKYFPDMAKYGLAGIIPGLLTPLGPIGGLLVGGAFGYLKNNEKFTNKYFGEDGKLTIKSDEKKILEKLVPGAAKGAAAGLISTLFLPTPFGILGNAVLGAGLGMMSTTEDFKDLILGKEINGERVGGLLGTIKNAFEPFTKKLDEAATTLKNAFETNIIDPISNLIKPAIHALPIALGSIPRFIGRTAGNFARKHVGKNANTFIGRGVGKVAGLAGGVVTGGAKLFDGLTSIPGKALTGAGNSLKTYSILNGDYMGESQQSILDFMDQTAGGSARLDKKNPYLRQTAKIGTGEAGSLSKEQAESLLSNLTRIQDEKTDTYKKFRKANDALNNKLEYTKFDGKELSRTQKDGIYKAARDGDYDKIADLLMKNSLKGSKHGLTETQFNDFMNGENGLMATIKNAKDWEARNKAVQNITKDEAVENASEDFKKIFGMDLSKVIDDKDQFNLVSKSIKDRLVELEADPESNKNKLENENEERTANAAESILKLLIAKQSGDDKAVEEAVSEAKEGLESAKNRVDNAFKDVFNKNTEGMSDTRKAQLNDTAKDLLTAKGNGWMQSLPIEIVNNITGNNDLFKKLFTNNNIRSIINNFEPEAIQELSKFNKAEFECVITVLSNKFVVKAVKNGAYKIDKNTVDSLANKAYNNELIEKCTFLAQAEKELKTNVYKDYESLDGIITNLTPEKRNSYGVNYNSSTGSATTDIKRQVKRGAKFLGRNAFKFARGAAIVGATAAFTPLSVPIAAVLAGTGYGAAKGVSKIKDTITNTKNGVHSSKYYDKHGYHDSEEQEWNQNQESNEQETEQNGLGTILLGAGRSILSGAGSLVKGAGSLIGSLFKKKKDNSSDDVQNAGLLGGALALTGLAANNNAKPTTAVGNTDEVDKPNDGRDVLPLGDGYGKFKTDSSGNVEPDTADSKTKALLNKLELKEKLATKAQEAQTKMAEIIQNNFDTSNIKGSKKGKLGWIELLLMGGYLWKTGILGKIFEGVVKPLWTGVIKPLWTDHLKPWITDTAVPWITEVALPKIGSVLTSALITVAKALVKDLPGIIKSAISGGTDIATTALDAITGNRNNAGVSNTVDVDELVSEKGTDYELGLYDENGNAITTGDLQSGNYTEIYNSQGVKGAVNKDGDVTFDDPSRKGTSYLTTAAKISFRSGLKSFLTGSGSRTLKAVDSANNLLLKGGLFSKAVGASGKAITLPGRAGEYVGTKFNQSVSKQLAKSAAEEATDAAIDNATKTAGDTIKNAAKSATEDIANNATKSASKVASDTITDNVTDAAANAVEQATKNASKAEDTIKTTNFILEALDKLFSNNIVYKYLKKVAKFLGESNAAKWIKNFKSKLDDIFTKAVDKCVGKVGANTLKVVGRVFAVVTVVTDFVSGWDKAESILGVTEVSPLEGVVAGILKAVLGLVPFLSLISDWLTEQLFKILGTDVEERQAKANEEYEQYKKEHGSTLTLDEYLEQEYSLTGKAKNRISTWWNKLTGKSSSAEKDTVDSSELDDYTTDASDSIVAANASGTVSSSLTGERTKTKGGILSNLIGGIDNFVGNLTGDFKFESLEKILKKAREGNISIFSKDYWNLSSDEANDTSLQGTITKSYTMLSKLINFPMLMVKGALDGLVTDIESVGEIISGNTSVSNSDTSTTSTSNSSSTTTFGGALKNLLSTAWGRIKSFFGFGTGTGNYKYGTGIYSKQIDPSIAGTRFNTSSDSEYQTIGDSGCGPAAAVNALESMYGRGNAVVSAAQYALNRGYKETDGGTKPGFFSDYFSKHGYGSQTSYNKSDIERNINSGMPTVIMGSDSKGTSSSTPFGKTPHYVTVTGTDGKGNAIVQDPESRYDNQLYPIKSLMKNTSLGVSAYGKKYRAKSGRGKWGRGEETVIDTFQDILMASDIGKAFSLFEVSNTSSTNSSATTTSSTTSSTSSSTNSGTFPTYDLTEDQIKGIANILEHEQPGLSGMLAEASLMANLTDMAGDEYATTKRLIEIATGGWFAYGRNRFYNPGNPSEDAIKAATVVLVYGRRTVPRYVNEHDCFSDLSSVTNDGSAITITNRSSYVPFKTKIYNCYGSAYTFYCFPNSQADPFGYTSEEMRAKWGDECYDPDAAVSGLGKNYKSKRKKSKFGHGKWGRGDYGANIWWYLKQMGMSDAGAAGLMGNLYAESGLQPNNVENLLESKLGVTDLTYTAKVDSGDISKEEFLHPLGGTSQYGYGLAQWTSPGRKEGLYNLVKSKNVSIADLSTQLEWLGTELNDSYSSVLNKLKSSNSLSETSNIVLTKFEAPADQSDAVKSTRQGYGQTYLNKYQGTTGEEITGTTLPGELSDSDSSTGNSDNVSNTIIDQLTSIIADSSIGKAYNAILGLFNSDSSSSSSNNSTNSNASGDAASVVEIAKKEVGTAETDPNYIKYNDWYYGGRDNYTGEYAPWCAAFTSWVGNQAGVSEDIIPKTASTKTSYSGLVANGGKISSNSDAKPGDLVYFSNTGTYDGIYHTGIVTGNDGSVISTIEGNSGNMVAERSYDVTNNKVLIARPQYENVGTTTNYTASTEATDIPDIANTRGGNDSKPLSRYGQFKDSIYGTGAAATKVKHKTKDGYVTVERHAEDKRTGETLNSAINAYRASKSGKGTAIYGMAGTPDYSKFMDSIVSILMTIADNTDKLNLIVTILNEKLNLNITASDVSNATTNKQSLKSMLSNAINGITSSSKLSNYADDARDSSVNSIISAMNAIASE